MDKRIPFNREELQDLLSAWTDVLYSVTPIDNPFDDNCFVMPDFLDALFGEFEQPTSSYPQETLDQIKLGLSQKPKHRILIDDLVPSDFDGILPELEIKHSDKDHTINCD